MRTVCVLGLCLVVVALAQARLLDDDEVYDPDVEIAVDVLDPFMDSADLGWRGHCHCCKHGCWCHAYEAGLYVSITMEEDETDTSPSTQILAFIKVGKSHFEKKFDVNKLDDFCETVEGREFCFDFDIKYRPTKFNRKMKGCVKLTKPKEIELGCFWLPLIDDVNDDDIGDRYDDTESEADDGGLIFE